MTRCPKCNNDYLQEFVCVTCGAQQLYGATLAAAERDAARYRKLRRRVVVRNIQAVNGTFRPGFEIAMGMAFLDCNTVRVEERVQEQAKETGRSS